MKIYLVQGTRMTNGYRERGEANSITWNVGAFTEKSFAKKKVTLLRGVLKKWIPLRDNPKARAGIRANVLFEELRKLSGDSMLNEDNTYFIESIKLEGVNRTTLNQGALN